MLDTRNAAVIGYYNMMRTQDWIGNLSLVVERVLFGQAPLNELHGTGAARVLEDRLPRLAEIILPLQECTHRMMIQSLKHPS